MPAKLRAIRISAHRNNIDRYRELLGTGRLTPGERAFVERRIAEEKAALEELARKSRSVHEAAMVVGKMAG